MDSTTISKYAVLFTRHEGGYMATIPDVPGVGAVGRTLEETQELIKEALMNHAVTLRDKDGAEIPPVQSFTQYLAIATSQTNWADQYNSWKFVQLLTD